MLCFNKYGLIVSLSINETTKSRYSVKLLSVMLWFTMATSVMSVCVSVCQLSATVCCHVMLICKFYNSNLTSVLETYERRCSPKAKLH